MKVNIFKIIVHIQYTHKLNIYTLSKIYEVHNRPLLHSIQFFIHKTF